MHAGSISLRGVARPSGRVARPAIAQAAGPSGPTVRFSFVGKKDALQRYLTGEPAADERAPGPLRAAPAPAAQPATDNINRNQFLVFVPPHPLIKHWLAVARNKETPPPVFRNAMSELGRLLVYEAVRDWLPTAEYEVETPCGVASATIVDPRVPIKVVPILRAGMVLLESAATLLPNAETHHLGLVRNEVTLEPSLYLNKLPAAFVPGTRVLVSDPMLATGGTMLAAIEEMTKRGASLANMRVVCVVAAPPALKKLAAKCPGLHIYTACIDAELDERGYIKPGLGDAGDRAYGTL